MVINKNCDITLYNRYVDKSTGIDKYQRTVIEGCNWQGGISVTVSADDKGITFMNGVSIIIDRLNNYMPPKKFAKLSDNEKPNYFTFNISDKIVKGKIDFEITGIKPNALADLVKNFDDVIDIKGIDTNLPSHFEIEGV
ncbi:DUF6751 family protein [Clostridium beijerinckii]|uniref:DUF6751 family protein n=1 Tax=Clostridium beijerinckii TaxID=1520 RepID=UPI00098C2C52|nr:DUF6751 family protein [Clostridium beijerinckii]MBA8937762.1 hypothetical protein [Clostridium beijerinckii]NRU41622.1 hypothetical protein [Clostridium beijerinckii]NSB00834.1 hypothetical protein [Clostridium beijerinckii]OOM52622.1 hypothetical protein CLOBI_53170 [Clostridium beijerinckii]OOM65597.1 hypothetical protein CLBEIC_50830 [Clostridium beijerinckii]